MVRMGVMVNLLRILRRRPHLRARPQNQLRGNGNRKYRRRRTSRYENR
jgi:hypothetical protein